MMSRAIGSSTRKPSIFPALTAAVSSVKVLKYSVDGVRDMLASGHFHRSSR
jgi:hypothetical protein